MIRFLPLLQQWSDLGLVTVSGWKNLKISYMPIYVCKFSTLFRWKKSKFLLVLQHESFVMAGAQWLSRSLDSRLRGCRLESHRRFFVVSFSKTH